MKTRMAIGTVLLAMALAAPAFAESYRLEWTPVTGYNDGTPFEAGRTVTYTVYWSTDPSLSAASLKVIASGLSVTNASFDPVTASMGRGETIYLTCRSTLDSGDVSDLSSGISWQVPQKRISSPRNTKIIRIP